MIEFASPGALWLLLPALGLLGQRWISGRNVLAVPGFQHLRLGCSPRVWLAQVVPGGLQLLGLALCIVALARPRLAHHSVETEVAGMDILLAVDTSNSMSTPDFERDGQRATRLQVAKQVVAEFVEARPNDRIGLVVFGDEALTLIPLTLDHRTLVDSLAVVDVGMLGTQTAIGSAIAIGAKRLKALEAPDRLLILLTDGADSGSAMPPLQAARASAALGITLHTIGIGRGSVIESADLDEPMLTAVAEVTGGRYHHATDSSALGRIFRDIDEFEPSPAVLREVVQYEERYRWWLAPGLACLGASLLLGQTVFRRGP